MAQKGSNNDTQLNPVINEMVDIKSGQVVEAEYSMSQIGRTIMKFPAQFSESLAKEEYERHSRKKAKPPTTTSFLSDRIHFLKKGFREYLNYREILQIYPYPFRDNILMLYVEDEKSHKQSYESYQGDNADDLSAIVHFLKSVVAHPKRIICDCKPATKRITSDAYDVDNYREQRSTRQFSRSDSHDIIRKVSVSRPVSVMSRQPSRRQSIHTIRDVVQSQPRSVSSSPPYRRETAYVSTVQRVEPVSVKPIRASLPPQNDTEIVASTATYVRSEKPTVSYTKENAPSNIRSVKSYAPASTESEMVGNSVTYLRTDKINGPQIMDNGPVYMYVAREKSALNRASWCCDSP